MRSLILAASAATALAASPIKNIIVLMFENRAFDHFLGHLGLTDPRVDGINFNMSNPVNTSDPNSAQVFVSFDVVDGGPADPKHDFDSITWQVFGYDKPNNESAPVRMDGFVQTAPDAPGAEPFVMSAFNQTTLPVLSGLATEYAVFDHWFAACPCPTNPNREFMMSGTSNGMIVNTIPDAGFPQQTHYTFLQKRGIDWKIYYNDDPWMAPAFADLRTPDALARIVEMPAFFDDVANGTLPRFSLIQPRMASSASGPSNWQHPDNSVAAGEAFLNQVYSTLRASDYWKDTLLLVTFDEHGGFSDHMATPTEGIPPPDGVLAPNGFGYDRLGVRIPTVAISPWIAKNSVINAPTDAQKPKASSQWDTTSIIATANKIFGISESLTARDAWAASFDDLISGATPMRTDCPLSMPAPPQVSAALLAQEMRLELNDHHYDSLNLLCALAGPRHPVCAGHADKTSQAAYAAELAGEFAGGFVHDVRSAWEHAADFPNLHAPVARLLRQQHFEEISKPLWAHYKASVLAGAQEGKGKAA